MTHGEAHVAGFVGLIGWTNVGKSTLVNRLTGTPVSITSKTPQTTRNRILGIVQTPGCQMALVDTPGIHRPVRQLSHHMIKTAWLALDGIDLLLWVTVADKPADFQLRAFKDKLLEFKCPLVIAVNKIDLVSRDHLLPLIQAFHSCLNPVAVVPISALTGDNTTELLKVLQSQLPVHPPIFPEDDYTDKPERFLVSELIREQIIANTYQELPHTTAVEIIQFRELPERRRVVIHADIIVGKGSQKGIVLGSGGSRLKAIGTAARAAVSRLLQTSVELRLWVRVKENWTDNDLLIKRLGYSEE